MNITGACHCGNIQFSAEIDPKQVVICHCTDCQTLSGSAFRINVAASPDSFTFTRGQPKTYVKLAQSGSAPARLLRELRYATVLVRTVEPSYRFSPNRRHSSARCAPSVSADLVPFDAAVVR